MDALTHAIEAYVSTAATPVTDASAVMAIALIAEHLRTAVHQGEDLHAREQMAYAQMCIRDRPHTPSPLVYWPCFSTLSSSRLYLMPRILSSSASSSAKMRKLLLAFSPSLFAWRRNLERVASAS